MTQIPSQIGPYEITREVGRGGMGVVYLARDTKLDRDVAIKCLPDELAQDEDRMQRFEREAKLLASLNHPNIATIHGLEDVEGKRYIILEYIEGETLEERLQSGAIPLDEVLPIAVQIAEAIEAAHDKGVIHRDLKPANIKFTTDDQVKVLDFGLAKAIDDQSLTSSELANSPTIVAGNSPTLAGVVLGTAGYLSPEQARGRPVDKRTDIFSFGCVLYEMLVGKTTFSGETVADSLGATLHKDPIWSDLPDNTPPTILLLLRRCLTKDRKRRLHDIADARVEIEDAIHDPTASSLGLATAAIAELSKDLSRRRLLTAIAIITVACMSAAIMWFATSSLRRPTSPLLRLVIPSQTEAYKYASNMVVSPDGTRVAFVARRASGDEQRLWVRRLDEFEARELDTETSGGLFWSHDSRYIGFHANGRLWSIRADGADKRPLASIGGNLEATWNAAGVIVMARGEQGLRMLRVGEGSIETLTTLNAARFETAHVLPHFLPDGNRYLYLALTFNPDQEIRSRTLYAGNLETGEQSMIGRFSSNAWYVEPGRLVYVEDGTVKSVSFDAERLRIIGEPSILAQDAYYFRPTGDAAISASRTGVIVFTPQSAGQLLVWFDAEGNRLGEVGTPATYEGQHRIAPDGRTVAAAVADPRTMLADIMLLNLRDDTSRQLTFGAYWEGDPVWSPDSKTIYFSTDQHGWPDVYSLDVSGSGTPQQVFSESGAWFPADISPDGRFLSIFGQSQSIAGDIWIVPLEGEGKPFAFNPTRGSQSSARFSPDGNHIAYISTETGSREIFVDTFPDPSGGVQVSMKGGFSPVWSPDGKKLYFGRRASGERKWAVMVVEFSDSDTPAQLPPKVLFNPGPFYSFDAAPDGEQFLLRIMPDETPDNHVILNWVDGLKSAEPEDSR